MNAMDPRARELLNLELDNRLDPAGRAELEGWLEREPNLRRYRNHLREVARALALAPTPPVPMSLRRALATHFYPPAPRRRLPRGLLAMAASAVIVVGSLPFLLPLATGPASELAGTLAPARPTVEVSPVSGGLQLVLEVPPGVPGDVTVEFADPRAGQPGALVATADGAVRPRVDGRRIVLAGLAPGRTILWVEGEVSAEGMSATLVRGGGVTQFSFRPGLQ